MLIQKDRLFVDGKVWILYNGPLSQELDWNQPNNSFDFNSQTVQKTDNKGC